MIHELLYKIGQEKQTGFKMRWTQKTFLKKVGKGGL